MSNRRVCNRCVPHILHESMEAHMHGTHDSSPTLHDLATAHVAVLAFPRRAASWILRRLDRDGPPLPLIASEVPRHTRAAVASLAQCCGLYDQVRDELTLVGVAEVLAEVAPPPRPNRAPVCRACVLCTSCSVQFHHYAVRAACSGAGVQELVSELRQRTNRALSAAQQLALHRRQTAALMAFAGEHNLRLANIGWSYEGCRPPGERQRRPHTWIWARCAHGQRDCEAQIDFVLIPQSWGGSG